jgi:hypothetical protein
MGNKSSPKKHEEKKRIINAPIPSKPLDLNIKYSNNSRKNMNCKMVVRRNGFHPPPYLALN